MVATRLWRMRSAPRSRSVHTRFTRRRCVNGRCWQWHAVNGAGPRTWPAKHPPFCSGPGRTSLLVCAVQARLALHRGDAPATHQQLVSAQRLRPLLTYAQPHLAVQARIELTRVHLALADLAGARTLMREIDELLKRRPGLGTLAGEAAALRARLAQERGSSVPGSSALTAAELRLLPMLCHPLVVPRDRRRNVPVAAHHQIGDEGGLPEAGRLLTQPGGHPGP